MTPPTPEQIQEALALADSIGHPKAQLKVLARALRECRAELETVKEFNRREMNRAEAAESKLAVMSEACKAAEDSEDALVKRALETESKLATARADAFEEAAEICDEASTGQLRPDAETAFKFAAKMLKFKATEARQSDEARAEISSLRKSLEGEVAARRCVENELQDWKYRCHSEWKTRAEKAEAELEAAKNKLKDEGQRLAAATDTIGRQRVANRQHVNENAALTESIRVKDEALNAARIALTVHEPERTDAVLDKIRRALSTPNPSAPSDKEPKP